MLFGRLKKQEREKRSDKLFSDIARALELVKVEIVRLDKEIDMINAKIRSKFFKGRDQGTDADDQETGRDVKPDFKEQPDGLDELRALRRQTF